MVSFLGTIILGKARGLGGNGEFRLGGVGFAVPMGSSVMLPETYLGRRMDF